MAVHRTVTVVARWRWFVLRFERKQEYRHTRLTMYSSK